MLELVAPGSAIRCITGYATLFFIRYETKNTFLHAGFSDDFSVFVSSSLLGDDLGVRNTDESKTLLIGLIPSVLP